MTLPTPGPTPARTPSPRLARLGAVLTAAGVVVVGLAGSAVAHVSVTPSSTAAGDFAVLTFSVPHGCDGSATTQIAIQIPEGINAVTPTRNPLWDVAKEVQQLDPPVTDAHGNEITERVATVTYVANEPLPDGYRDAFELSLQLPDSAGSTLVFPVVQTCEKGEAAWIEVPAEGQDPDELELPAPGFTLTDAADDQAHDDATDAPAEDGDDAEDAEDIEASGVTGAVGIGVGALGVLLGGVALARGRARP